MQGRLIIALTFACTVAAGCKDDSGDPDNSMASRHPMDAVETNVFRHGCEDAGPCDAGIEASDSGDQGDETVRCKSDDQCPASQRCGVHQECVPRIGSSAQPTGD
jgi:hypothetical protein